MAELGVGAVTHSTLQLALGIAALLAGLGVVCGVMGVAFIWHSLATRKTTGALQAQPQQNDDAATSTPLPPA